MITLEKVHAASLGLKASMRHFRFKVVKIIIEVAKKDKRNEEIMKKSLKANSDSYVYPLDEWCVYTHQYRCVRTCYPMHAYPPNVMPKFAAEGVDDLSYGSLKARMGRDGVNSDVVDARFWLITRRL
ncbi:hypothetical protein PIB30_049607 [Stylosanthes scabra]|uniref:Uncharacterized protein n=1 Tax=Stylosanthes scabra TaxID=79078 RepID=A0ABU6XHM8_9FABA|nr:hypothetical protein [Stylosanthes scabra]